MCIRDSIEAVEKTGLDPSEIGIFFLTPCPAKNTAVKQPLGLEKSNVDGVVAVSYTHLHAAELTRAAEAADYTARYPALEGLPLLCDSDAHYLENIPEAAAWLDLEECTIPALFAVLKGEKARCV